MTKKVAELRQKYPVFVYQQFSYDLSAEGLDIAFEFRADPDLVFKPHVIIEGITAAHLATLAPTELDAYLFHLGLIEAFSYWKATCSPRIEVTARPLTAAQTEWWHTLLIKGMGEYFFVNDIDFTTPEFVTINSAATVANSPTPEPRPWAVLPFNPETDQLLIPIGGGKDSALTIELLNDQLPTLQRQFLLIDPTLAISQMAALYPEVKTWTIRRRLDPMLFELNHQGYLNGHTPFSAMAAFYTSLVAKLVGLTHIAVSNERSSNEGNVMFHGHEINHQYSKTYEFEKAFQTYMGQYFEQAPFYFSIMRPLFELQIARSFANYIRNNEALAMLFRSCNRGQKTNSWCGECPKCLFTYSVLYPFVSTEQLVNIFGADLYTKTELLPFALELLGQATKKPLECVGTHEENNAAFYLSVEKLRAENQPLPPLLQLVQDQVLLKEGDLATRAATVLNSWNSEHSLPPVFEEIIHRVCLKL